mmetsp:Transcript_89350/g.239412  ORF Transcript_89350/g.239412 Transcript_89350/m.239412 type:complete len:202 (-) Transcript_89350:1457-2062(-)
MQRRNTGALRAQKINHNRNSNPVVWALAGHEWKCRAARSAPPASPAQGDRGMPRSRSTFGSSRALLHLLVDSPNLPFKTVTQQMSLGMLDKRREHPSAPPLLVRFRGQSVVKLLGFRGVQDQVFQDLRAMSEWLKDRVFPENPCLHQFHNSRGKKLALGSRCGEALDKEPLGGHCTTTIAQTQSPKIPQQSLRISVIKKIT